MESVVKYILDICTNTIILRLARKGTNSSSDQVTRTTADQGKCGIIIYNYAVHFLIRCYNRSTDTTIATRVSFFFSFCLFGDAAFSEYFFCTIAIFSLYGEYVVRSFLPGGVFLPCDHGLDCVRIQSIKK